MTRTLRLPATLACAAAVAACTTAPAPPSASGIDALAQVERWTLQGATDAQGRRIDAAFPHGTAIHAIAFDGSRIAIEGGCNHIGGAYHVDSRGRLIVGPLMSTKRACTDTARMAADAAVSGLVEGTADWRIAESWPEQLFLDHGDGARSRWVADRTPPRSAR